MEFKLDMKNLYVISGVTGMTGNELARQLLNDGHTVIGFDNFFASSIDAVQDIVNNHYCPKKFSHRVN